MLIRLKLFIGFIILIVFFIINFFAYKRLSHEVIKNMTFLGESEHVIQNSNMLHKDMLSMQNAFRGYLLSDQESFLQPYTDGVKSIPLLLNEQRNLVALSIQQRRIDSISFLHSKWILYANSIIKAKKDTSVISDTMYRALMEGKFKREVGKKLNDQIGILFSDFDKTEYEVRASRKSSLRNAIARTNVISLSLTLISLLIGVLTSYLIVSQITKRIKKMVNLSKEISNGNFIILPDDGKDELRPLFEALNSMSNTLDRNFKDLMHKNKELDEFAYVVSHDLKAPLRGIDNITKWIEEDHDKEITPNIQKNLDLIKGRTRRLEGMINGLLDYARVGKAKRKLEKVLVKDMLNEIIDLIVPNSVNVTLTGNLPMLTTDKLHLEQVFLNLINNAFKHNTNPKPNIIIKATELGSMYKFEVIDNGPGIQKEYHEKIFMIFQTLQERDAFESTGVGLAIVKKIIADHNGTITVESEPGKGTTFAFTWPKKTDV